MTYLIHPSNERTSYNTDTEQNPTGYFQRQVCTPEILKREDMKHLTIVGAGTLAGPQAEAHTREPLKDSVFQG